MKRAIALKHVNKRYLKPSDLIAVAMGQGVKTAGQYAKWLKRKATND
jgi:hypothetical protein